MDKKVFETTFVKDGDQPQNLKIIARQNDTFCKPNLRINPLQTGTYPHLCKDSAQTHFDEVTSEQTRKVIVGTLSGTTFTMNSTGAIVEFPFKEYTVFSAESNCTVTATTSGVQVILSGAPIGTYWIAGYNPL